MNFDEASIFRITVKITDSNSLTIGTGFIINQSNLGKHFYIVTAAHCLYEDGDEFQSLKKTIFLEIFNPFQNEYKSIEIYTNEKLIFKTVEKDLAIFLLDKKMIDFEIPQIKILKNHIQNKKYIVKGFPQVTNGKEIVTIHPIWNQVLNDRIFNLTLIEDYNDYNINGFSGSGIFLKDDKDYYLIGVFTRYRDEEKGKVIYGQAIEILDELLNTNYLPTITYTYLGEEGINHVFFRNNVLKSTESLGERYSDKLNFNLPIARRFNELSFDLFFKNKILKILDEWVTDRDIARSSNSSVINVVEEKLQSIREEVIKWVKQNSLKIGNTIELNWFFNNLQSLEESITILQQDLREKSRNLKKNTETENPLESELSRLRDILRKNRKLMFNFSENINLDIVNNPILIIKGIAGSGKSHLLADIANNRNNMDLPTILLLGQTFNPYDSIEKNILSQLELTCNFSEFLNILNNIGKEINSRVLLLIDAINETSIINDNSLWKTQILGFINQFSEYPYIGITFSIRDTYWEYILPKGIEQKINIIDHEGFKGNEYEALKKFCEYFKLEQPNFPIMSPEFTNPLFLKLCCIGIKNSDNKTFPSGFNGVYSIFENYIYSIYSRLSHKTKYKHRRNIINESINVFITECIKKNVTNLEISEALLLFEENFPKIDSLLIDLIEEGLFIKSIINNRNYGNYNKDTVEIIYISYEKLSDYLRAKLELDEFTNNKDLLNAFQSTNKLGSYIKKSGYVYYGILEAFSVILPEKYNIELTEVYSWVFEKYFEFSESISDSVYNYELEELKNDCIYINNLFLKSLKWRNIESINNDKITNYFQSKNFQVSIDYEEYLGIILELSSTTNHPMNSDRLHRILSSSKMSQRDSFFQKIMYRYNGSDDNDNALYISRLIEFAWQTNISIHVNDETCRLTGQTLAWVLSTTNTILRDRVTKALVNLFEQKPLVLLNVLQNFKKVDDLYILERLYSVTYGVVLRTNSDQGITKLAQYTYDTIFKRGKPIKHILLRDYARNIIEYALYKNLDIKVIEDKIRPPYKSDLPRLPTREEVEKYHIDYKSDEFNKNPELSRLFNQTHFTTLDWDFGRKIVDAKIDDFYPISFTQEPLIKEHIRNLSKDKKSLLKLYSKILELKEFFKENEYSLSKDLGKQKYKEKLDGFENDLKGLKDEFNEDDYFVRTIILPYLINKTKLNSKFSYSNSLDSEPFKCWIVERVFKLGYNIKLHSGFDRYYSKFNGYEYSNHIERISKKYQWIALYEILAIIADNYKMRTGFSTKSFDFYKGTWQNYLRDIDPAYITHNSNKEDEDEELNILNTSNWFDDIEYKFWDQNPDEWTVSIDDFPKIENVIEKIDDNKNSWITLQKYAQWTEPKLFGDDKYNRKRKEFWFLIQGYLCKRADKTKITDYLNKQNLWNNRLPENIEGLSTLINREKFWSPADIDETKEYKLKEWVNIEDTPFKIIISSTGAKGLMEEDKSEANQTYNIPCRTIFKGLNLKYTSKDGDFVDSNNEIVVTNSSPKGVLIRKDILINFLKKNNLEIFWIVLAEKNAKIDSDSYGDYKFGTFSGVYSLKESEIVGSLKLQEQNKY